MRLPIEVSHRVLKRLDAITKNYRQYSEFTFTKNGELVIVEAAHVPNAKARWNKMTWFFESYDSVEAMSFVGCLFDEGLIKHKGDTLMAADFLYRAMDQGYYCNQEEPLYRAKHKYLGGVNSYLKVNADILSGEGDKYRPSLSYLYGPKRQEDRTLEWFDHPKEVLEKVVGGRFELERNYDLIEVERKKPMLTNEEILDLFFAEAETKEGDDADGQSEG